MRIAWILPGVIGLLSNATAADVAAYLAPGGRACPYQAKKMVTAIFKGAGVTIEWRSPKEASVNPRGILLRIDLAHDTPALRMPGALAVSYPFDRCRKGITVFLDRLRSLTRDDYLESELLAYVLVHEITHVIQGLDVHTEEGIMKARWSPADLAAIFRQGLSFAPEDLVRIRQALATGWCQASEPISAGSQSGIAVHQD
jgi:hypothetical protein